MNPSSNKASGALRFKRLTRKGYGAFNTLHRVVSIGTLTSLVLACAYSTTAGAQNHTSSEPRMALDPDKDHEIEQVTVTASKVATPQGQATKLVTVITARDIAASPARSVQDLLSYIAGVDVSQRGPHGVQADISIRGGSRDQTMLLLNGVSLKSAHEGHMTFDLPVNLSDIERIEVLRGPAALIYGAGAFSGAINIITRPGKGGPLTVDLSGGMHRLFGAEARSALSTERFSTSLSASHRSSAGYRPNTDYRIERFFGEGVYQLDERSRLNLQAGYIDKDFGANSFYSTKFPDMHEWTKRVFVSARGDLHLGQLQILPTLAWDRSRDRFLTVIAGKDYFNNHQANSYTADLTLNYSSVIGLTTLVGNLRHEDIVSGNLGRPRSKPEGEFTKYDGRTRSSLTLEHTVNLDHWTLSAGALYQHTDFSGARNKVLPSVSASYRPDSHWSLSASWSKSLRLPTFTELWYTGAEQQPGTDLRPEVAEAGELTARYAGSILSGYLSGFLQEGTDFLDWVKFTPEDKKYTSHNIGSIRSRGLELGLSFRYGEYLPVLGKNSQLKVDYLYMTQTHDAGDLISKYTLNYLRHKLGAHLNYQIGESFEGSWHLRYQDRVNAVKPYATLDAKFGYRATPHLRFALEINNITNTQYADLVGMPQPGLWLSGGVTYSL